MQNCNTCIPELDTNNNLILLANDTLKKFHILQVQYNMALFQSWYGAISSISFSKQITGKDIQDKIRSTFDAELKNNLMKKEFSNSLSELVKSYVKFAKSSYMGSYNRHLEKCETIYEDMMEPIRDYINRTPSEVIQMEGRFEIHHYKTSSPQKFKTPILIVGSLINRYYILDLVPETSVIRYFHELGFDVYATDWRIPITNEQGMSLESYAHDYLENAVEKVREITKSPNVTLFGYCWGGILSLMYSALHPETVRNLVLHATPTDFNKSLTVLESWINNIDIKKFVDVFGNIPSSFLNIAFWLRNPFEAFAKPFFYFSQPRTLNEIVQFLAVEFWLYDSVPIIGKAFEQIIEDIYKKNLLIQNKMMLGTNHIDLRKVTMPLLNIVGTNDDLVSAESSRTVSEIISSQDKKTIEFPTGHVGLCISKSAHKKLWPQVGKWLMDHSA